MLYISGGGNYDKTKLIDLDFYKNLKDKRIIFNPVAKEVVNKNYDDCYKWLYDKFNKLGKLEIINEISFEKCKKYKNISGIYIGGGNTYKLLKLINEASFFNFLLDYISGAGIVYGASAGAVIFGKSIATYAEENNISYLESNGLDLIDGYSVRCHFEHADEDRIFDFVKRTGFPVVAIPVGVAILVTNKTLKVIGERPVTFVESDLSMNKLYPGDVKLFKNM